MYQIDPSAFSPIFPLFMYFYIIGAESYQKALYVKKSLFGEILIDPEFFRDQGKTQEVMPIQSYFRKKSINQKLEFAISLEPLIWFVRNFGFRTQFLQGSCFRKGAFW
jgi:hypothetical protein